MTSYPGKLKPLWQNCTAFSASVQLRMTRSTIYVQTNGLTSASKNRSTLLQN